MHRVLQQRPSRAPCRSIKDNWDPKKTLKQNYAALGLVADVNSVVDKASKKLRRKFEVEDELVDDAKTESKDDDMDDSDDEKKEPLLADGAFAVAVRYELLLVELKAVEDAKKPAPYVPKVLTICLID